MYVNTHTYLIMIKINNNDNNNSNRKNYYVLYIFITVFVRKSAQARLLEISILPHTLPGRCWLTSRSSHRFAASGVSDLDAIRPQKSFADTTWQISKGDFVISLHISYSIQLFCFKAF